MSISMHYFIKLQVEESEDGLYRIVDHHETHVTQDLISQMPILGSWYNTTIRNAMGQFSLAGTNLLEFSGFLEFAPRAVDVTKQTASSISRKIGRISSKVFGIGGDALEKTGVPGLVNGLAGYVKWGAASLIEEGKQEKIDCYSPSCIPGTICYSPTCPRGRSYQWISRDAITSVIKGAYSGTKKSSFFRSNDEQVEQENISI
jgi:hypothetical protein